jgi:hypothetical protein
LVRERTTAHLSCFQGTFTLCISAAEKPTISPQRGWILAWNIAAAYNLDWSTKRSSNRGDNTNILHIRVKAKSEQTNSYIIFANYTFWSDCCQWIIQFYIKTTNETTMLLRKNCLPFYNIRPLPYKIT